MKKIILPLFCFFTIQFTGAQTENIQKAPNGAQGNKKIYIHREGGKKKLLTFGKIGYNTYHFTNLSDQCDTLICKGSGFEICKIDKEIIRLNKSEGSKYQAYNTAIRQTEKRIRKSGISEGKFELISKGQKMSVSFYNANNRGEAEMIITLL